MMLAVILLAAGRSSRMGSPKALLRDAEDRTFVARIVRTLAAAGYPEVTVVTGQTHDAVRAALEEDNPPSRVRLARNLDPDRGQLSSIWTGMDDAVRPGVSALMLALVDAPFFTAETVAAVVATYQATGAPIVRPARDATHGHPVIFDRSLFEALRQADPTVGAKAVVRAHAARIVDVAVNDDGAFTDIDTPDDYARVVRIAGSGTNRT